MCISLIILFFAVELLNEIKSQLSVFCNVLGENEAYLWIIFKMVGITYLCEFCGGICKDAGYQSVGTQVDIFGKMTILLSGIPILMALIKTIQGFAI